MWVGEPSGWEKRTWKGREGGKARARKNMSTRPILEALKEGQRWSRVSIMYTCTVQRSVPTISITSLASATDQAMSS